MTESVRNKLQIYEVVQACMKAMPHVTSTRELPPQIIGMPTDTRSKVIHELYTTEYTYVNSLETLSEVSICVQLVLAIISG